MRLAIAALLVATPAFAQSALPGSDGDPIRELMVHPAFVSTELPVLAMHGGNPEDTVLLFDGFELPRAFYDTGVRSIFAPGSNGTTELQPSAFGVEYGRGSSILSLSSEEGIDPSFAELTVVDTTLHARIRGNKRSEYGFRYYAFTARYGRNDAIRAVRDDERVQMLDLMARTQYRISTRWSITPSLIVTSAGDTRYVLTGNYETSRWTATIAASVLDALDKRSIDSRAEVVRKTNKAAGLTQLEWRLGQQTNSAWHEFADMPDQHFWRNDIGVWSSVGANLSDAVRATAGLRVDDFNGDVATQPRASIIGRPVRHLTLALGAGAYRRPPNQPHEAEHDLNPERATHVATGVRYEESQINVNGVAYYIDRSRLVIRDTSGELHNTGLGTSMGMEVNAQTQQRRWFGGISAALTRSKRFDYLRAAERPSEYEQPFRFDLVVAWYRRNLILSGRVQLASGLPYTPFTGAIYNSDTDTYVPLYVPPQSARAPFHHQLDLRVDYRFSIAKRYQFDAFLDLHNAYDNRDPIAYRYSYDYSTRTAITALPLFPFAGLRAYL